MIIHKSNSKKETVKSQSRLGNWVQRYRKLLQVAGVGVAFLVGILVQRQGFFGQLRVELGLSDQNLTIIRGLLYEPATTLDVLLHAELPTIYVDVKFDDLKKIEAEREKALQQGVLLTSEDNFVPAEIRFEERTIRIKMRLKGDLTDHFERNKWSYRIHVKGDDQLFGMRRFSIQHPRTRKYLFEWGWLENLRLEGILAPRYRFVNVVFNGDPLGIYALEEHFSRELLESQQRREGIIITFDESYFWQRFAQLGHHPFWSDRVYLSDHKNSFIEVSRPSRVDNDPILSREREEAVGLLRAFQEGKLPASEVFDASSLGTFLAVSELWQTYHALHWNNMHFYYNPLTAKLEPIGFDGTPDLTNTINLNALDELWTAQALRDPIIAQAYVEELSRISQADYLDRLQTNLKKPHRQLQLALFREYPFVLSTPFWESLNNRQNYLRRSLDITNMVLAFGSYDNRGQDIGSKNVLTIEVRNILSLPVEIVGFQVGDSFVSSDLAWTGSDGQVYIRDEQSTIILAGGARGIDDPVKYTIFRLPASVVDSKLDDGQAPKIEVVTRLLGTSAVHLAPVRQYPQSLTASALPSLPSVQQALIRYPFLEQGKTDNTLLIRQGEWDVIGDLVLPRGVRLQAGPDTTLRFGYNAIFVSTGPLEFQGTAETPVVLAPLDDSWGGLVVLEAGSRSIWKNVIVKNTHGIERRGWILTGGITFYESPLSLVHSHILGSEAEDGINIVRSPFEIRDSEFSDFASDAFDGDFTEGVIETSVFRDVQGDAIDVSGSNVRLSDVILQTIGDKGISAGEISQIDARDILIVDVGIAVASKDRSHVQLERGTIRGAGHFGLAAFEKKREYGPASITAVDIEFSEVPQRTLVQRGSWIKLDGNRIEGSDIDVTALYDAGLLGN